jgi:hypothetical protein
MHRILLLLAALVAIGAVSETYTGPEVLDQGDYKIFRNDRPLGAETFVLVKGHDSLVVRARQYLTLQGAQGDEPLERAADLLLSYHDWALHNYQSSRTMRGTTMSRSLVLADTHYVAYRQVGVAGEADSRILPPGRFFVMDAQLISLFDLIGRTLHGQSFESRPVNLLALGPRDTLLDARAVSLGNETIRWGGRPVVARKLHLVADDQTTFTLWIGPRGQLLRLLEPVGGLRAEREAPAVKKPAAPRPRPGG